MNAQPNPPGNSPGPAAEPACPQLLVRWGNSRREFLSNLSELPVLRNPLLPRPTSDAPFTSVFIREHNFLRGIVWSLALHTVLAYVIFAIHVLTFTAVTVASPLRSARISYYSISEFLPALQRAETLSAPAPETRKAAPQRRSEAKGDRTRQPALAKQEILSVATDAAPGRQVLITPIRDHIAVLPPLPSLVATAPKPLLEVPLEVVAPRQRPRLPMEVAPPVANLPVAAALQLPERAHTLAPPQSSNIGAVDISPATPPSRPPKLSLPQPVVVVKPPSPSVHEEVKPPPLPPAKAEEIPLLALTTKPIEVQGPIDVPLAVHKAQLEASPKGREDAGEAIKPAPAQSAPGAAPSAAAAGKNAETQKPEETLVAKVSSPLVPSAPSATIVVVGVAKPPAPSLRSLMASAGTELARPRAAPNVLLPQSIRPEPGSVDAAVFGRRGYHVLTVNLPNMTSVAGSWEIHFSELGPPEDTSATAQPASAQGSSQPSENSVQLHGFSAIRTVDPAYPADLMREGVEGVVMLYAVIHADGSVSNIKVMSGVDQRLDASAAAAFARWRFQPALKNGKAVELEAVAKVPFRLRRLTF